MKSWKVVVIALPIVAGLGWFTIAHAKLSPKLLNASYGPTRTVFKQYDADFETDWKQKNWCGAEVKQVADCSLQIAACSGQLEADSGRHWLQPA